MSGDWAPIFIGGRFYLSCSIQSSQRYILGVTMVERPSLDVKTKGRPVTKELRSHL